MKKTIGDYLIDRLKDYGIEHIFGVPGDYNLSFLDQIDDAKGVKWIGNCNELNAAYAADGYGRIRNMAAIVTTFGVGELSAINGVGGSCAENVPVVKIVGMPSTKVVKNNKLVHHTLGDGNFERFNKIYKEVTIAQTVLNELNAKEEIDRVLRECSLNKKPVYIGLPVDITTKEIEVSEPTEYIIKSDVSLLNNFVTDAKKLIKKSNSQMILADYEVNRFNLNAELKNFVEASNLKIASLSMGKGVINENHKNFVGVYYGALSNKNINTLVQDSDLAFLVGVKLTDSITAGFSYTNTNMTIIEIHPLYCKIGENLYSPVLMQDALKALSDLDVNYTTSNVSAINYITDFKAENVAISQKRFYEKLETYLEKDNVLISEQGTSFSGCCLVNMKEGGKFVGQPLWGSIGYTVGALLGTQIADTTKKNILVVGDGSFQLTAQEVSTMIRQNLKPTILLINNDGYTVERLIHGENREYNDIHMWDYTKLVESFDIDGTKSEVFKVKTEIELCDALDKAKTNDKLSFIEVFMEKMDCPQLLKDLGGAFSSQNNY